MRRRLAQGWCFNLWLRSGGYEVLCAGKRRGAEISQGLSNRTQKFTFGLILYDY